MASTLARFTRASGTVTSSPSSGLASYLLGTIVSKAYTIKTLTCLHRQSTRCVRSSALLFTSVGSCTNLISLTRAYAHAFAEIQPIGHAVSARMPNISRIFIEGSERAIEAIRAMYGFPAAGFEFGKWFTKALNSDSNPIPLRQNLVQPCLYAAVWPPGHRYAGEYYIVYVHSES
jgi:hypothetical protein